MNRVRCISLIIVICWVLGAAGFSQIAPQTADTWPDLSGDWAMIQILVATADLPIVGRILIDTIVGAMTHITQTESLLLLQDRYCFTDAKPSTMLFRTDIADIVMQSIVPPARTVELSRADCDICFHHEWHTEIRGAVLENPETEALPTDSEDPRVIDLEGDGHPGMTIQASILGLFTGEGYAVQRYRYRLEGTVLNANTIIGTIDWTSEQTVLAATNPLFLESFTDGTHPDPARHRFVMVRADSSWTCETLRERLPDLLILLEG